WDKRKQDSIGSKLFFISTQTTAPPTWRWPIIGPSTASPSGPPIISAEPKGNGARPGLIRLERISFHLLQIWLFRQLLRKALAPSPRLQREPLNRPNVKESPTYPSDWQSRKDPA